MEGLMLTFQSLDLASTNMMSLIDLHLRESGCGTQCSAIENQGEDIVPTVGSSMHDDSNADREKNISGSWLLIAHNGSPGKCSYAGVYHNRALPMQGDLTKPQACRRASSLSCGHCTHDSQSHSRKWLNSSCSPLNKDYSVSVADLKDCEIT